MVLVGLSLIHLEQRIPMRLAAVVLPAPVELVAIMVLSVEVDKFGLLNTMGASL